MEDRVLLSVINWTGKGDGLSWADTANWSGGHAPGVSDMAVINQTGITVHYNGSNTSIEGLTSTAALDIAGGSLTVTSGNSSVSGGLTVEPGATLTAMGVNTVFTATGKTIIDGANLNAEAGAHMSLAGAASYSHAATSNSQVRQLEAVGTGSLLDLSGITTITNGTDYGSQIQIAAMAGAIIDLSGVTQIADGNGGDYRVRAVTVTATSAGSIVKLNALTSFTDGQAGDTSLSGDAAFSRLNAYGGGALQTPSLTTLDGVYIDEDTANSINTSQITSLKDGQVDFTGTVVYDLANVSDLTHTNVNVGGANRAITFPKAATIDGASFDVTGGAHYRCRQPQPTTTRRRTKRVRHFDAAGPGSLLDLSALTVDHQRHQLR